MRNDLDLKQLWDRQDAIIPDAKELFEKARGFGRGNLRKLYITNLLLITTSAFIIFIWHHYQPAMITTRLGMIFIILAMLLYLLVYNQMIPLLKNISYEKNNNEYLEQLLKFKRKQLFLQNTMTNIYFILLTTGLCMYMIEYALRMNLLWRISSYALTILWIAINWFYFRPKTIRRQQAKLNGLIDKFETVKGQLNFFKND